MNIFDTDFSVELEHHAVNEGLGALEDARSLLLGVPGSTVGTVGPSPLCDTSFYGSARIQFAPANTREATSTRRSTLFTSGVSLVLPCLLRRTATRQDMWHMPRLRSRRDTSWTTQWLQPVASHADCWVGTFHATTGSSAIWCCDAFTTPTATPTPSATAPPTAALLPHPHTMLG